MNWNDQFDVIQPGDVFVKRWGKRELVHVMLTPSPRSSKQPYMILSSGGTDSTNCRRRSRYGNTMSKVRWHYIGTIPPFYLTELMGTYGDDMTTDWLGTNRASGFSESFPEGALNAKQLRTILSLDDRRYGKIVNTGHGVDQPILKLTEEITEVHLQIGKGSFIDQRATVIWLDSKGNQIASAVWIGGPKTNDMVESYWIEPENLEFKPLKWEPITKQHEHGMWSLGLDGAVPLTRQFIKEHYVKVAA